MNIKDALRLASDLSTLVQAIVQAVAKGDTARVDKILPAKMQTTLAKAAADEKARQKFEGT